MGRSSLLFIAAAAIGALLPAHLRAADPLDCIPPTAQVVVVADNPRKLAEAVTGLEALQKSQKLAQYRAIYDSAAAKRAFQLLALFEKELGAKWPELLDQGRCTVLKEERRENFTQQRVKLETAPGQFSEGWLLIPDGAGPFPAVLVVFYEPETSVGLNDDSKHRYRVGEFYLCAAQNEVCAGKFRLGARQLQPSFLAHPYFHFYASAQVLH